MPSSILTENIASSFAGLAVLACLSKSRVGKSYRSSAFSYSWKCFQMWVSEADTLSAIGLNIKTFPFDFTFRACLFCHGSSFSYTPECLDCWRTHHDALGT